MITNRTPQACPMVIHCEELTDVSWQMPFYRLLSERSKVHLWMTDLRKYSDTQLLQFCTLLSPEEQNKLRQLHFDRDKRRFIISKAVLRKLLARYLNKNPRQLSFCYDINNKPYLYPNPNHIHFNVSHSDNKIIVVLQFNAKEASVGVDVERIDNSYDYSHVIRNFFSAEEQKQIRQKASTELFFQYWTRKEAIVKALGIRLTNDIRHLNVAGSTNICSNIKQPSSQPFYVHSFKLDSRYMVSFALRGQSYSHSFIDYDFIM